MGKINIRDDTHKKRQGDKYIKVTENKGQNMLKVFMVVMRKRIYRKLKKTFLTISDYNAKIF